MILADLSENIVLRFWKDQGWDRDGHSRVYEFFSLFCCLVGLFFFSELGLGGLFPSFTVILVNFNVHCQNLLMGKEGLRNKREITLVCIGGNERERKEDRSFPFKSFQLGRD
jgi:hypothetical protein